MSRVVKFGIYGAGNIARLFCETVKNVEDVEITAVCAFNYEQAKELARDFSIPSVYEQNEELASDPNVDAIYVGTLHTAHFSNVMMALNGGKHVLCEKAFMINSKQAAEVIKTARDKKLLLMEAMWTRFHPVHDKVMSLINEGAIGEVTMVSAAGGVKTKPGDRYGRVFDPKTGGGAVLDFGCYSINQVIELLGEDFNKVYVSTYVGDYGVDERDTLLFHYNNGKQAVVMCSCTANLFGGTFIYGTDGFIKRGGFTDATLFKNGEPPVDISVPFPEGTTGYEYELRHFVGCLSSGKLESDIMPHSVSLATMRAIDEAYEVISKQEKFFD